MPGKTALLVIDLQVAMFDGGEPPFEGERVLANTRALIDRARAAKVPVLFVRHEHNRYEPMMRGNPGFEVHPAIAPVDGEMVIDKRACDAFCDTPLDVELRKLGIEHLVIAGMQTEQCIDTACRSAMHRGFDVTLAGDAHTTWTRDDLTAAQIIAHHNLTLADLPHPTRAIVVRPAAEISF